MQTNLRMQQGDYIKHELASIKGELDILKDALHHKIHCDFNQCTETCTGLTRRNHIKQINWQESNSWQETLLFENDFQQPEKIKEVPGT